MRFAARVGVVLALLSASVTLPIAAAHACTCADIAQVQQLNRADAVFIGKVIERDPPAGSEEAATASDVALTVDVNRVYKGKVSATQVVTAQGIAGYCGLTFAVGDTLLVFANSESSGGNAAPEYVTKLCSGTETAATAPKSFGDGKTPIGYTSAAAHLQTSGGPPIVLLGVGVLALAVASAGWLFWNRRRPADESDAA